MYSPAALLGTPVELRKAEKHRMSDSSVSGNILLKREVRVKWTDWFDLPGSL